jgi:NAD(P)-dependent dehydrogenase (short-subunit alcohol dehydrogenase family)
MRDVAGRVAVVTGGASGIGRAMAEVFGAAGMKLVIADVDEARADEAARSLKAAGAEAVSVRTDVSDPAQVDALARRALDVFGAVHVVCNNAGVAYGGLPTWESTVDDWHWVVGVNLMGVVHGARTFTPILIAQGEGHIVNTASIAGLVTSNSNALYAVTKHAVVALSESLFNELAACESGVGVSVLCPGFINTELVRSSQRNAPARVREGHPELYGGPAARQMEAILANAPPPIAVGEAVLSAIRAERFWILPSPEFRPLIRHRCENVLEERDPTASPRGDQASRPPRGTGSSASRTRSAP